MTVHLIKLSVGPESLADLETWQKHRLKELKAAGKTPELMHVTRMTPKRAEELLDGGSIYWVIKGWIVARQKLLELRPLKRDGIDYCGLVHDKKMIPVHWQARRPFQGWRYLDVKDVPTDKTERDEGDDLPIALQLELKALGLL